MYTCLLRLVNPKNIVPHWIKHCNKNLISPNLSILYIYIATWIYMHIYIYIYRCTLSHLLANVTLDK